MHVVVTDVSVLAVDDDALNAISLALPNHRRTHIKVTQSNDLSMSHALNRHRGHQGELISLESVEEAEARVLHLGGMGGSECGDGHLALR